MRQRQLNNPDRSFWLAIMIVAIVTIMVGGFALVLYSAEAQEPEQPYGDDFLVDYGEGMVPYDEIAPFTLTGLKRAPTVHETYYPQGAPPTGTLSSVQEGTLEWNSVTSAFQYTFSTAAGLPATSLCAGSAGLPSGVDGINSIVWHALAGSTIGLACWNTGANECDIVLDSDWGATATSEEIRTVQLHEAGHCAGIGHSEVSAAVMAPSLTQPKHLHTDDIAALCAIYGCAVTPTATFTPTATATATVTSTPKTCANRIWQIPGQVRCARIPQVARD